MNILIVAATEFEVKPLLDYLKIAQPNVGMNMSLVDNEEKDVHVLITGVGMVNTAMMVGRYSALNYDLVLNVGVCGAFDSTMKLGQLVNITQDILSEMGAEDGDNFITYDSMGLPGEHIFNHQLSEKLASIEALKKVKSITVNTVHGNEGSIEKIKQRYHPDVENMEGAAFFAACKNSGINFDSIKFGAKTTTVSYPTSINYTQIRAVSNYVEKRDKSKWQMPLAISNLNNFLIRLIEDL